MLDHLEIHKKEKEEWERQMMGGELWSAIQTIEMKSSFQRHWKMWKSLFKSIIKGKQIVLREKKRKNNKKIPWREKKVIMMKLRD